ncbi:MAG TPA: DUF1272 domain-containing protein [Candidatus Elarobacter sp.]|jgi:hypothetical protein|nr:DUF1272 domain-containing protein [Candidatus Elarobacter sp.]
MLAYVFWHQRRDDADDRAYRAQLDELHRRLAAAGLEGFTGSRTFALDALPWGDERGAFFEDWYVVGGSAALDRLDRGAVTGDRSPPHDELAASVAWGTGGLFRLHSGDDGGDQRVAQWFAKPDGMSYAELQALLARALTPQHVVWQRQMTLGPGFEFCVAGPAAAALPERLEARMAARSLTAGTFASLPAGEPAGRLLMRARCMKCGAPLPWEADASICSFECTYCPGCAVATGGVCPDCGGELVKRPRRAVTPTG